MVAHELYVATPTHEFSRGGVRTHPTTAVVPNACFSGSAGSLEWISVDFGRGSAGCLYSAGGGRVTHAKRDVEM